MHTHLQSIGRWARQQSKVVAAVATGAVIGTAGSVLVHAAIPDGNTVHACYTNSPTTATVFGVQTIQTGAQGEVRVIDSAATCPTGTTAINWDQHSTGGSAAGDFLPNLAGANLVNVSLQYRNFAGADLHGASIGGTTTMIGADFHGANLSGGSLATKTVLTGVNFAGTNFTNATISDAAAGSALGFVNAASVAGANFTGATIARASFSGGMTLTGVNFTNAQLNRVDFTGTNLTPATLTGVTWTTVTCPDATISDANSNTCIGHLVP